MALRIAEPLSMAVAAVLLCLLTGCADSDRQQTGGQKGEGRKQGEKTSVVVTSRQLGSK